MIVPVATEHVGCAVTLAVGAAGVEGCALIVTLVPEEIQLEAFFAVTLYVPAVTLVNMPVEFE